MPPPIIEGLAPVVDWRRGRDRTDRDGAARPAATALRDAEELHAVFADEDVARWLWPGSLGGARTLEQVRSMLVHDVAHWKRHRFGAWLVRDRDTRAVVGRVGLEWTHVGGEDAVEVAWAVASDRWGEGLATEAARAAVKVAFGDVGLREVVSFTLPDNVASRRVMERLGFSYERDVEHAGLPHVLYRLRAAE
jgi:[ribosomal protein S5]-alanine N-acetyltransferase